MKERGKGVEIYSTELFTDYSLSSDLPCKKHPSSSAVGICAYCLKDRLSKLVCSDCGEQRLSSCSCSEISSNRNSCNVEVGSVGRISFLLENDQRRDATNPKSKSGDKADVFLLKRSRSSCVEIKRKNGFWRIGRLFRKKRDRDHCGKSVNGVDEKSDLWVVDYMGVSRSRSLCSFRGGGGGFFGSEDGGDLMANSGARSSMSAARSSISAARSSSVFDAERRSGFSEAEPRKSGFDSEKRDSTVLDSEFDGGGHNGATNRRVFSLKETYFSGADDSGFIDLKFDFSSETRPEFSSCKMGVLADTKSALGSKRGGGLGDFVAAHECGGPLGVVDRSLNHGGSCRIDRGIKRSRKSFKGWRWIFGNHPSARKKEEDLRVKFS
ncbi:hypothetical protein CFOL_v3_23685 [Cephalotus follicularis]|uniref:DUF740 domain-containing protein n=1 Tax=Cephalotus follicularis TaxID=3775 RepID=A0A1Q3CIY8_CEPFO|nr:hypothetical protein CFOL_v3_23685 [Cephalotus follicularis]